MKKSAVRLESDIARHAGNASRAACTARSISSARREVDRTGLPAERRVVDRPAPPRLPFDDAAADPVADALDFLVSFDGRRR